MTPRTISLIALVVSLISACLAIWTSVTLNQRRIADLDHEITLAATDAAQELAKNGKRASSVRISGSSDSGYKCSAVLDKEGSVMGEGRNPTVACVVMVAQATGQTVIPNHIQ